MELPQTAQEFLAEHETVIRFILNNVTDADEFRMRSKLLKLSRQFRGAQIHPAYDALDARVLVGE